MHAMAFATGRADRTVPARTLNALTIRPRGSAVRRPLRTMIAIPLAQAAVAEKPARSGWTRWLALTAGLAFAGVAVHAAVGVAGLPSSARTQSVMGAPEVAGYVADANSPNAWVPDVGARSYEIDPKTYAITLIPPALKDIWAERREIRWATRWPAFWTSSSRFVALNLAFGFLTIGALVLASSLGAAGERARR